MEWLGRSWEGDEELWKLVWVYGVLIALVGQVALVAFRLFTDINFDSTASVPGKFLNALEALYCVWMLVSLWRCAPNADWSIWVYFVRPAVIAYVMLFCLLCYTDKKVVWPQDVVSRSAVMLREQISEWFGKNKEDSKQKSNKKPVRNFKIKVTNGG